MKENILSIAVTAGLALVNVRDELTAWVGLVCTLAVTVVTCIVQVYRAWRDRDVDKHKCNEDNKDNEDNETDREQHNNG